MNPLWHRSVLAAGALLLALMLAACPARRTAPAADSTPSLAEALNGAETGAGAAATESQPHYLVTVTPLKLILDPLVAGRGSVEVLLPPGASAHIYEPKPSDATRAAQATALLWIGEDFDGFAAQLEAPRRIELLPLLPEGMRLAGFAHHHGEHGPEAAHAEAEHGHAAEADAHGALEGVDPHFFTDPLAVRALLPALTAQLARLDPAGADAYSANAAAFAAQLAALDAEAAAELAPVRGQATLLFHPSFGYLFQRYGIELAGVIEEFPGKEPSPKYLQELSQTIRARKVRAIFTETLLPQAPARAVAEATGTPVLELDPSCGASARAYADYRAWLMYNVGILRKGLSGGAGV